MLWTEVKNWAKTNGYTSFREKIEDTENRYDYYWAKIDDPSATGLSNSVSKLARDIYNHITYNKFIDYQAAYELNQEDPQFNVSDYGS
jgi:hypothetical protein